MKSQRKDKQKIRTRKMEVNRGVKNKTKTSYLANYDSRKEHQKIIQNIASNKRNKKIRSEQTSRDDKKSQGSGILLHTGSDFLKDIDNKHKKSTFFKKKDLQTHVQNVETPLTVYEKSNFVGEWNQNKQKETFLSKTDDLKFLKELARDSTKKTRTRRGSSAYTNDNKRLMGSNHNNKILMRVSMENKKKRPIGGKYKKMKKLTIVGITKSLIIGKKQIGNDYNKEGGSKRENQSNLQKIKQKYLGTSINVNYKYIYLKHRMKNNQHGSI